MPLLRRTCRLPQRSNDELKALEDAHIVGIDTQVAVFSPTLVQSEQEEVQRGTASVRVLHPNRSRQYMHGNPSPFSNPSLITGSTRACNL